MLWLAYSQDSIYIHLCGEPFTKGHTMICMRGGLVIQRHNELQHLEEGLLNMVCKDVATEPRCWRTRCWRRAVDTRVKCRMQDWISMHMVFGSPRDQPFLIAGFVTLMLNPIGTSSCSKSIVYMRRRKSVNTQVECPILNMEHSPLWFLQQLEDWERSSWTTTAD